MSHNDPDLARVRAVKAKYEAELLAKPGVVAVGVGLTPPRGDAARAPAIVVSVNAPGDADLPDEIEGVPVVVHVTGAFKPR